MSKSFIKIRDLSFSYSKQLVLNELNADFEKNTLNMVLGKNGSGKSTLFQILSGIERDYTGTIYFGNSERNQIYQSKEKDIRIGFLSQFHQTTFPFTVEQVMLTGRASFFRYAPKSIDYQLVEKTLSDFEILHLKDKPYTSLSGGERQLVLLGRILVQQPDVLLLDEPTNHLDLHYQVKVLEHLQRLVAEETTVVCVMHDPNLAFLYGQHFYVMNQQKLIQIDEKLTENQIVSLLEEIYNVSLSGINYSKKTLVMPKVSEI